MVVVAQLVRASDCDSEGRGFEPPRLPALNLPEIVLGRFFLARWPFIIIIFHNACLTKHYCHNCVYNKPFNFYLRYFYKCKKLQILL